MHHLAAWYESVDGGAANQALTPVPEQVLTISGDDVRVPSKLANLIGGAMLTASTTVTSARFESPSMRATVNFDLEPILGAVVFGSDPEFVLFPENPVALKENEGLQLIANTDNVGAAVHWGLAWLADGPQQPVKGKIFSIRATAAAALAAGAWVNSALTFSQTLPAGRYQVVGMRARGANLVAARLVFVGGMWRPGVPAINAVGDLDNWYTRYGRMGVFGEFDNTTPPTVDCLGVTDSAQTIFLDLIQVG